MRNVRILRAPETVTRGISCGVERVLRLFRARSPQPWDIRQLDLHPYSEGFALSQIDQVVDANPGCLWILPTPTEEIIAWAECSSALSIGIGDWEVRKCPMSICLESPSARFADAVGRFVGAGYRRVVGAIEPNSNDPDRLQALQRSGLVELERNNMTRWPDEFLTLKGIGAGETFSSVMVKELGLPMPCGVVCERLAHLDELVTLCEQMGFGMPGEVGAVVLEPEPDFSANALQPAHYRFPVERAVRVLEAWVEGGGLPVTASKEFAAAFIRANTLLGGSRRSSGDGLLVF